MGVDGAAPPQLVTGLATDDPATHEPATPAGALQPLTADATTDVCVVGAGITGLTTAYLLLLEGVRVVVLDHGVIGGGETARTTGHLSNAIDARYGKIERWHGPRGARLAAESHTAAIARIEEIVTRENISCEFERVDGYLWHPSPESWSALEYEREAAVRAGLADVGWVPRAPIDSFDTGACLRFPRQAQLHPARYLQGLAQAIRHRGGAIHEITDASDVTAGPPMRIRTRGGPTVTAQSVVVATNAPVHDDFASYAKQAACRSYVIAATVPHGEVKRALYWDTESPYHHVRVQRQPSASHDLLLVGGEDHRTGQAHDAAQRYARLESWARERFPAIGDVLFRWSGQILEPIDGLAYIGRNPGDENGFVATGFSGMGLTHGTIAGMLLTDLIVGQANVWQTLYDPERTTLRATWRLVEEGSNTMRQYADWLMPGDVASTDEIQPGCGAVLRRNFTKVAVYRDELGALHQRSAVCPHLDGIVRWNSAERTWDCPCHGSRFDAYGRVVSGPANRDLRRDGEA
jgi:glycine/D-amino acid oxidase-like deaminating enzyme/nitrite reductase/ring-hydroxylating ferredoxin subunit